MKLDITGRNFAVTAALRQAVGDRLMQLLDRESLKITSSKAVLKVEKGLCYAEVLVSFKNHDAAASASGATITARASGCRTFKLCWVRR